jgi:hypothetical protein
MSPNYKLALALVVGAAIGITVFGCATDRSPKSTDAVPTTGSTGPGVTEAQIAERLQGEGLRNVHLEKEAQGWTARAITPEFRPVTIQLDERGNVLGAPSY